jgi:hypothetical protein
VTDADAIFKPLADRIAAHGRDALVERLRKAYADAAAAHSDIVSLDSDRIEAMVQSAADRADGLQWRRALASVAADELGVSLAEALTHPAVMQAQQIVGAPSYEASLAELVARPVPPPPVRSAEPEPEPIAEQEHLEAVEADQTYVELLPEPTTIEEELAPEPTQPELIIDEPEEHGATGELDLVEADEEFVELLPPPEPIEYESDYYEPLPSEVEEVAPPLLEQVPYVPETEDDPIESFAPTDEYVGEPTDEELAAAAESYGEAYGDEHTDYPPPEDGELQVTAYHLGGVANLPAGRTGLDLRLSESGLDILQPEGDIIGRLHWNEIDTLEVSAVRGRLRRQLRAQSRILVRTKHGDASFEIPGVSSDELEARVEPLLSRYGAGD